MKNNILALKFEHFSHSLFFIRTLCLIKEDIFI